MNNLKVEYVKVSTLTPYAGNAKKHPKEQVEQIKASIEKFGMNDPIAVWGKDNTIVEGHGRVLALKEMGIEEAPIIHLDHMTDEERRAYTLAHNKINMNSGFDYQILDEELALLNDIDMGTFGFMNGVDGLADFLDADFLKDEEVEKKEKKKKKVTCPHCGEEFELE